MDKQLLEQEAEEYSLNVVPSSLGNAIYTNRIKVRRDVKAAYIAGATSSSTVKELEREVERLRGLIDYAYYYGRDNGKPLSQFKTENNL